MTLLHATAESERRILAKVGTIVVLGAIVAAALCFWFIPSDRKRDVVSITINTDYVGQGVASGTPLIMHGVKIGEVVSISSLPRGGVRLDADMQTAPARGLTDAMEIDYRPSNYFGVTGIDVTAANEGRPIENGMTINITPKGNNTLQALLYRFGELSNGVFDQRMISVIDRATEYVDGLDPLLETALVTAKSVANVQTVSTERLLRNSAGISVAFPSFIEALLRTGNLALQTYPTTLTAETADQVVKQWNFFPVLSETSKKQYLDNIHQWVANRNSDVFFDNHFTPLLSTTQNELFTPIGVLESSHVNDLLPVVESVRALTDAVPKALSADNFASSITELRSRFERMYAGSGEQRALQVRIVLDRLPGVAAPIGSMMGLP